jgi:hypothetical protein
MRTVRCVSLFVLSLAFAGFCGVAQAAPQQLTIPNFDPDSPACMVKVPQENAQCTATGCAVATTKTATATKIQINFSCLPTSAPTGFENPASDMKVYPIKSVNGKGHLSLIDDMASSAGTPMQEVNFCLFGESNNFCGNAKIARTKRAAKSSEAEAIKQFVKQSEFMSTGAR